MGQDDLAGPGGPAVGPRQEEGVGALTVVLEVLNQNGAVVHGIGGPSNVMENVGEGPDLLRT
jgi:hypothetical protein